MHSTRTVCPAKSSSSTHTPGILPPGILLVAAGVAVCAAGTISPTRAQETPQISELPSVRAEREKNAPLVMAEAAPSAPSAQEVQQEAVELEALRETQKRLREVEKNDPARALAEYKKFWQGRQPVPYAGVLAAQKVVQLRQALKDVPGALLTCEVMEKKYAAHPSSALLVLQRAQVLEAAGRKEEAAQVLGGGVGRFPLLQPEHFPRVEEVLLRLADARSKAGEAGKRQAGELLGGVEAVYLKWLQDGTVAHTWQMFEALQAKYQQVGAQERADALLPGAAEVLLKVEATAKNPEGSDASLMAARWLGDQGRVKEAQLLYAKVPAYNNRFVTQVVSLDQGRLLLSQGQRDEGRKMLEGLLPGTGGELRAAVLMVLARSYYSSQELAPARRHAAEVVAMHKANVDRAVERFAVEARTLVAQVDRWEQSPILCEPQVLAIKVKADEKSNRSIIRRLSVRTLRDVPLEAMVSSADRAAVTAHVVARSTWEGEESAARKASSLVGVEQEVVVEIKPQALRDGKAILTLSSPLLAGARTSVALQVSVE